MRYYHYQKKCRFCRILFNTGDGKQIYCNDCRIMLDQRIENENNED